MKIKLFKNNLDGTIPVMQIHCANCFYKHWNGCIEKSNNKRVDLHFKNPAPIEDPEHSFCKNWWPSSYVGSQMVKKAIKNKKPELIKIFEVK